MSVTIIKPGLSTTLQDAGRPGHAALGVGRSGAMDGPAWQIANALVGNGPGQPGATRPDSAGEAALECTLLGPTLRFARDAVIAITGAPIEARVDGLIIGLWTPVWVRAGSVLQLGGMSMGCRSYLAVRGGFGESPVLGSRSSDQHAGIGFAQGRALRADDVVPYGGGAATDRPATNKPFGTLAWSVDPQPWFDFSGRLLDLLPGRHAPLLDDESQRLLHGGTFTISKDSNRTASRLDGHTLHLREPLELISEATLPGTLQLPPSGQPIALLAEAPVTGGYPRLGQIAAVDLPRLAQRRPGDTVCFRPSTLAEAITRLAARERRLAKLIQSIAQRLQQG